jgi:hypothetical protein
MWLRNRKYFFGSMALLSFLSFSMPAVSFENSLFTESEITSLEEMSIPKQYAEDLLSIRNPDNTHYFDSITTIMVMYEYGNTREALLSGRLQYRDKNNNFLFDDDCLAASFFERVPDAYISECASFNSDQIVFRGCDVIDAYTENLDMEYARQLVDISRKHNLEVSGNNILALYSEGISLEYISNAIEVHKKNNWDFTFDALVESFQEGKRPTEQVSIRTYSLEEILKGKTESFIQPYTKDAMQKMLSHNLSYDHESAHRFLGSGCNYDDIDRIVSETGILDKETIRRYAQILRKIDSLSTVETEKPNAKILLSQNDFSGAIYNDFSLDFYYSLVEHYDVQFHVIIDKETIPDYISKSDSLIVIAGHGSPHGIIIGSTEKDYFTESDTALMNRLSENLKDGARVFLYSCETAEESYGFAKIFDKYTSKAMVFASEIKLNAKNIIVDSWYPFEIRIRKGFDNFTYPKKK